MQRLSAGFSRPSLNLFLGGLRLRCLLTDLSRRLERERLFLTWLRLRCLLKDLSRRLERERFLEYERRLR